MTESLKSWVRRQQGRYFLRRGLNLAQQGDQKAAIWALTKALAYHSKPQLILLRRGKVFFQESDFESAYADFGRAIALDPNFAAAYGYRGLVQYQKDNEAAALADWEMALSLDPGDATVRYNRGLVLAQKGELEAALVDFDLALTHNPLLSEAYLHRGKIKQQLGQTAEAVKDWEIALCNDLRLNEAHHLLAQAHAQTESSCLQDQFQDLLPEGFSLTAEQQGSRLILALHRPVGTPVNYFKLSGDLRDRLVNLQLPEVRRFRLIAKAGDSSLSEWDQTYGIYDKAPCPPARWRDALATTLLLFPPLGVLALVFASQVEPAYRRGDYPVAARASQAVRKLFFSSGALMGLMLFGLASYGVYTYVEGEYPNPAAKTALVERDVANPHEEAEEKL